MKIMKSRLAIILAVLMVFTSFEVVGVFAAGNDNTAPAVSEEAVEADTLSAADETDPAGTLGDVKLKAYSGCDCVHFMWDDVEGADGYSISVNGGDWKDYAKDSKKIAKVNGKNHFKVKAKAGLSGAEKGEKAKLKVKAYAGSGDSRIESAAASKSDYPVRGIAYKLTIRISGTLKSHGGPSRTIKVKRGQVINAYGFGGGKYIFKVGKSIFYCNKIRTGNRKCVYTTKWNYSKQEAEFYVKDKGLKSKTNKLIWVNGYTQHVYLFKKSKGEWVVQDDWECATGKASAPTPTGVTGNKAIWQKLKSRHALKWWSSFSDINSFHGKHKNWSVGTPASKGCIRNPTDKAKLVYDKAKIGTKVFIY